MRIERNKALLAGAVALLVVIFIGCQMTPEQRMANQAFLDSMEEVVSGAVTGAIKESPAPAAVKEPLIDLSDAGIGAIAGWLSTLIGAAGLKKVRKAPEGKLIG